MAGGTGLPLPKTGNVLTLPTPVVDGDRYSSAAAWNNMARSAAQVADAGFDLLALEERQQKAKAVADFETENAAVYTKLRDQHAHDPVGYEVAADAHNEGALSKVPGWMAGHAKQYLGGRKQSGLATVLSETRARNTALAAQSLDTRTKQADNEVMGLATAGKIGSPQWQAALDTYHGVLDTAVSTNLMHPDKKAFLVEDLISRATGESAARDGVAVYREKGFEAAVEHLRKNVLDNDKLTLKTSARQAAFNRGLSQIRLQQAQDKDMRTEVVEVSKDIRARIKSQQPVDEQEVTQTLGALRGSGAAAEHHRLAVDWAVRQQTEPMRTGNMPLRQMASVVAGARGTAVQAAGLVEPGNIDLNSRPVVKNADGSISTVRSLGVNIDGKEVLVPTVSEDGKIMSNEEAIATYKQTGRHLGKFDTPQNATAYAKSLSAQQRDRHAAPFAGEIAKGVQSEFVKQVRGAWPQFKAQIDKGVPLEADDLTSIRYAAALSGDANWQREVEGLVTAQKVGAGLAEAPAAERAAGLGQVQEELRRAGLPVIDQQTIVSSMEKQFERQSKQARENPVGYWIERGGKAPEPLNLSNPQTAAAGAKDRYSVARMVGMREEIPPGVPFRPEERQSIAAAIRSGNPDQTAAGFETLHAAPDDMLVPALKADEIKGAVIGAAHSTDPARFMSAMSALDRLYARAPEDVAAIYGGDVFKQLQDWQAKLRYHNPQELAEALKRRDDPQVRERQKINIEAGEQIARQKKPDSLIGEWQSAFGLFGAGAPVDARTRDAWMQDYVNLFGERYAVSLDKDMAHKQAVERMKHYWQKSSVNGGRLTLYPPELTYQPDASGSYGWMRTDLENDIKAKTGKAPTDYTIIADPTTQREVDNRQPASYLVAVKNDQTGEWDLLRGGDQRPQRYKWDAGKAKMDAREWFATQRERTSEAQKVLNPGFDEFGTPPVQQANGAQSVDEAGFAPPQQSGAPSVDEAGFLNPPAAAPEASGAQSVDEAGFAAIEKREQSGAASFDEAGFSKMAAQGKVPDQSGAASFDERGFVNVARETQGAASFDEAGFLGVGRVSVSPQGRFAVEGLPIKTAYKPGQTFGREATANAKPFSAIIVHHTATDNLSSALNTARGDPFRGGDTFGYHFYIDLDGTVTQAAPLEARTNHVQPPESPNRTGRPDIGNSNAVGISFVGKSNNYTKAQLESGAKLAAALMRAMDIPIDNIVGHGEVQKNRQKDEGLALVEILRAARMKVASR